MSPNMNPTIRIFVFFLSIFAARFASGADYPAPTESDSTIHDFKFASGETLPELRVHYRTLGKPAHGVAWSSTRSATIRHGPTATTRLNRRACAPLRRCFGL